MTPSENSSIVPRSEGASDAPFFAFYRNGVRFYPQAGARLSFASRTAASLHLPGLPTGMLDLASEVAVKMNGEVVFSGKVEKYSEREHRGAMVADVTCLDGWNVLERRAFRQTWKVSDGSGTVVEEESSRVVLNVDAYGQPVFLASQISEICSSCGIMSSDGGLPWISLPADEIRNVTCADAIRRCLRFFPQVVSRFDPVHGTVSFSVPSPNDAAYVGGPSTISRSRNYTAHPIVGVDIATEEVDTSVNDAETGVSVNSRKFTHQTAGDVDSDDCLHVFIPLDGAHASNGFESLVVETEEMPLLSTPRFWKEKHPRLANVALTAISISEAGRSSTTYDKITSNDIGSLRAFGLNAEVVQCHCKATVTTEDNVEEDIYLTMDFTTTDASSGRHTRQTGSSATAAELLPDGLAQAILDQRGGSLESEDMQIRVGDVFPKIGDSADGLVLQNFEVDCDTLVANLHFGHPDYLTPEDMRELMNGFRARGTASNVPIRAKNDLAEDAKDVAGGIQPLTTTEFAPGTKKKTTVKASAGGGSIVLDSTKVGSGKKIEVHYLKFTPSGASEPTTVKFLAEKDVEIPPDGGGDSDGSDDNGWDDDGNPEPGFEGKGCNAWAGIGNGEAGDDNGWGEDNCSEVNEW